MINFLIVSFRCMNDRLVNVVDFRTLAQDTHFKISIYTPPHDRKFHRPVCDNYAVLRMSIIIYLKPGQLLKMTTLLKNHPTFQFLDLIII